MRLFIFKSAINFMKLKIPALVVSTILVLGSLFSLFTQGLNLGLDFTGGTVIEVKFEQAADLSKVRGALAGNGFAAHPTNEAGTKGDDDGKASHELDHDGAAKNHHRNTDGQTQHEQGVIALGGSGNSNHVV